MRTRSRSGAPCHRRGTDEHDRQKCEFDHDESPYARNRSLRRDEARRLARRAAPAQHRYRRPAREQRDDHERRHLPPEPRIVQIVLSALQSVDHARDSNRENERRGRRRAMEARSRIASCIMCRAGPPVRSPRSSEWIWRACRRCSRRANGRVISEPRDARSMFGARHGSAASAPRRESSTPRRRPPQ